jgi:capsid protein
MARIHPLTGEPLNGKAVNGHPRPELRAYFASDKPKHRAALSIDAARSGNDLDNHWAFADSLSADGAYSQGVRHTLIKRSRYEGTSNALYAGIIATHVNMLVGVGPTLRMLTGNRGFNQLIEREWFRWTQAVQFRRKLWAMAHAVTGDGDTLAILQTNPVVRNGVQLDFMPIEAEQCQSPFEGLLETGQIDGIIYDEFNNVVAYDILPHHPGSTNHITWLDPVRVPASQVLHWFKLKRPGAHRGIPAMTAGMNTGAYHRRFREATVAAAETAADVGAMLTSSLGPAGDSEPDPVAPFSTVEFVKRMLMVAPMGWDAKQMKGEHPNAQYAEFHRTLLSELARGISMPYNAAACDSSTYSFASGKLDTLCYRAALDVERADCNDLILDPLFTQWFREWRAIPDEEGNDRRSVTPNHQWDWPTHPVIDAVSEESARDTKLKNGTLTFRQACSDQGRDAEDEYTIMAEDMFGEASDENVAKCRQIVALKNTPQHAIQYVAQLMGIEMPSPTKQPTEAPANEPAQAV